MSTTFAPDITVPLNLF